MLKISQIDWLREELDSFLPTSWNDDENSENEQ